MGGPQSRAGRCGEEKDLYLLYPQEDSWYSFLLQAESTPRAIVRLEELGALKKSNDFIGNQTRDN
jgi:hypothetical protein